ncbi:MAG TPA: hypothetical protein VJ111_06610 [Chitinophagaceae bacterium]|nr:hypothetical protein [Chitinophagaceae bacterium]
MIISSLPGNVRKKELEALMLRLVKIRTTAIIYLRAGHSVTETAYDAGFATSSYFAKYFKDQYDLTLLIFISGQ